MKKIKLILVLMILISSGFNKIVVADTTYVNIDTLTSNYTLAYCVSDSLYLYSPSYGTTFSGYVKDGHAYGVDSILITQNNVTYFNGSEYITENITTNGEWLLFYSSNIHIYIYPTSPTTEPWPDENIAICGSSDTLYAENYEEGLYYIWEEIGVGVVAEGYYPNDTSYIVDHTCEMQLTIDGGCNTLIDVINLTLTTAVLPNLGPNITVCDPDVNLTLSLTETYNNYLWSNGSTEATLHITAPGIYYVDVWNGCMTAERDSIIVTQVDNMWLWVGYDRSICNGTNTELDMNADFDVMSWSRIVGNDTIWGVGSGRYFTTNTNDHMLAYAQNLGCPSMMDDVVVTLTQTYDNTKVHVVTVEQVSGKNQILYGKEENVAIASYNIHKEIELDVYAVIGNVLFEDEPEFLDLNSDPTVHSDKYKISIIDTCGNESPYSYYHKSIFVTHSESGNTHYLIVSDPYEDEEYIISGGTNGYTPVKYYILEDLTGEGTNFTVIDSMSASNTAYALNSPPAGAVHAIGIAEPFGNGKIYPIKGGKNGKDPVIENLILSNRIDVATDINRINMPFSISIYPNPSVGIVNIDGYGIEYFEIMSITGQMILSKQITNNKNIINLSQVNKGLYLVILKTTFGPIVVEKIIIQ